MILTCLAGGNSVRGTSRLCDVEKRTVLNLFLVAGKQPERFMDRVIQNVRVTDPERDECWSFVRMKEEHIPTSEANNREIGGADDCGPRIHAVTPLPLPELLPRSF